MREGDETMGETGEQPVVGERRRRREAERAAALAAERAGVAAPLTRRELRRRQLEEEARLEAIATGELQLGPAGTYEARQAARAATTPAGGATTNVDTPPPGSSPPAAAGVPSRRSVRQRLTAPPERPSDGPAARDATATGRRPVVRTPTSATGIRRLDATGQLTGIQPVLRPDGLPQHPLAGAPEDAAQPSAQSAAGPDRPRAIGRPTDANTGTSDPTQWDDAVTGIGEIIAVPPTTAAGETPPARSASSATDAQDWADELDEPLPRPRWAAVSSTSGSSADEADGTISRRSLRQPELEPEVPEPDVPEPDVPEPDQRDDEYNPLVTIVKIVVLAFVAAIIGALIWLLATEAFVDDASAATPVTTIATTPEESSAR